MTVARPGTAPTDGERHILAGWLEYAVDVIPPDADDQDVLLLQLAFYSGAAQAIAAARRALRAAESVEAALAALVLIGEEVVAGAETMEHDGVGPVR